ncbi:MAG: thiamine-phosphate kinase [Burkholderiaceae bacterium]|nr:thiamine-phosphate kinase [Burkholderiaceae bacterium]
MGEFDLIEKFFKHKSTSAQAEQGLSATDSQANRVRLGIGDDCALLAPAPGMELAVSSDMLVEGRHFFAGVDPAALGHKALAVNLSDLAAMGAAPLAFTLALALPHERAGDAPWLAAFASGLHALADAHGCPLVGGDTTAGPLNICITVLGEVPAGQALRRDGAQAGDDIWASGTLGEARLALEALRGQLALPPGALAAARQRLERPTPRLALGRALRGIATSCIDVSDGLAGDLGHVLQASRVGATLEAGAASGLMTARFPASKPRRRSREGRNPDSVGFEATPLDCHLRGNDEGGNPRSCAHDSLQAAEAVMQERLRYVLHGGDDYELAFTAPSAQRAAVLRAAQAAATPVTRLGRIDAQPGLRLAWPSGANTPIAARGFDHFAC